MTDTELKKAIELVNSVQRGPAEPLLVHYVTCERCGKGFAKMAQDVGLAEAKGYSHLCRICKPGKRRA